MSLSLIGGEYRPVTEKIITVKHNDTIIKSVLIEIEKATPYLPLTISVQMWLDINTYSSQYLLLPKLVKSQI